MGAVFTNTFPRVANKEVGGGYRVANDRKLSLEERITRLEASQYQAPRSMPVQQGKTNWMVEYRHCHRPGHFMRYCPDITCFRCGHRGHMQGSTKCPNQYQGGGGERGSSCFPAAYSGPRSRLQYREKQPTANGSSVKFRLSGDEVVALCDTG